MMVLPWSLLFPVVVVLERVDLRERVEETFPVVAIGPLR
jgi:hypothetical protein